MSVKFIWVRNPTAINGLATTYVSMRGSDTTGDGTAQNPYRSLAKATTVAAAKSNLMIDDGNYNEAIINKRLIFYGNSYSKIKITNNITVSLSFYNLILISPFASMSNSNALNLLYFNKCVLKNFSADSNNNNRRFPFLKADQSLLISCQLRKEAFLNNFYNNIEHSVVVDLYYSKTLPQLKPTISLVDSIIISSNIIAKGNNNNFTNSEIPSTSKNSINNTSTGQTISNYFNYLTPQVRTNPVTATLGEWLKCDLTAKAGSANIEAGVDGATIGLNEGSPSHATNDSSDIFSPGNGATLVNVEWNSSLNGYSLVHKDKVCAGSSTGTITLAADAESTDDYYNGLFIGITAGSGYGEIHRITDYDGTTKVATIEGNWNTQPDAESIYSITGTIVSATKDYGKLIRIKQNWTFCGNMQSWSDTNDASYGMWKEFITTPLLNNGVWELRPCSNFRYEYSINGTDWYSNTELITGTDTDNKTDGDQYGNASENFVPTVAKATRLRYARFHIHIGFSIGKDAQ